MRRTRADVANSVPMVDGRVRYALAVELTYSCNQACAYCYNPSRGAEHASESERDASEPSVEEVVARVEKILCAWNVYQVTLTGGEPLRGPALFPVLDVLRARGARTQLISNGTLITRATASRLASYSLGAVQITLNGSTAEAHREHVGRNSFSYAIRGAENVISEGIPITGCIVVTRRNADQVSAILDLWQSLGVRRVALSRFSPAGMSLERMSSWLPRRQDLVTAFTQARAYARAGMEIHCTVPVPSCLFDLEDFAPIRFGQCAVGSPFQEFALGPDGALRLCTLHAGKLARGRDVLDPDWDLRDVPSLPEVQNYRARLPQFCQGCSAAASCLGGCSASERYEDEGMPRTLDPLIRQYFDEAPASSACRPSCDRMLSGVGR